MILGKKNFRMLKGDFEALVAELRPYISPMKHSASIGMVVNSFGVAICTVA